MLGGRGNDPYIFRPPPTPIPSSPLQFESPPRSIRIFSESELSCTKFRKKKLSCTKKICTPYAYYEINGKLTDASSPKKLIKQHNKFKGASRIFSFKVTSKFIISQNLFPKYVNVDEIKLERACTSLKKIFCNLFLKVRRRLSYPDGHLVDGVTTALRLFRVNVIRIKRRMKFRDRCRGQWLAKIGQIFGNALRNLSKVRVPRVPGSPNWNAKLKVWNFLFSAAPLGPRTRLQARMRLLWTKETYIICTTEKRTCPTKKKKVFLKNK